MCSEKRKFERYVFHNDDRIIILLALGNHCGTIEAKILNISQGGLGVVIERKTTLSLKEDAILFLEEVVEDGWIAGLKGHSVRVKWILDYKPLNNIAIGCEFIDLNEKCRLEIETLLIRDKRDANRVD
jgi:c-di-GMP-binding flagellar brake protein YcgR